MTSATGSAPLPRRRRRAPLRRAWLIGIGILCTLAGLALLSLTLPSAPDLSAFAIGAGTFLLIWTGGILMGRARGAP